MKRHGLWAFHATVREMRAYGRNPEWWLPEGEDQQAALKSIQNFVRINHCKTPGWQEIARCANRYARRYGGVSTVRQWNDLCELIARRGVYHHASVKAAAHQGRWTDMVNLRDEFSKPWNVTSWGAMPEDRCK